uniref:J domain-containing protein n=1 Tax=Kwoniella pini CBS 10737 TaxID=1296096 RepID=A0A1B9IC35_9TREE|nr:uncharacterized protein I206_00526 [Kwoniella pini CBS 10737]OCF53225.1 hypothetical protein I206_00526 [Kwoniella pini CBS 10737]
MMDRPTESTRFHLAQRYWRDATFLEPFLLPVWQVHLICDQKIALQREPPNGIVEIGPQQRYYSDMGLAISAVPRDHWASGMFFPWNIRANVETIEHIYEETKTTSIDCLPSETPDIYSDPLPHVLDPFMPALWNQRSAPKFAYGPPDLKGKEEKIILLQAEEGEPGEVYEAFVPQGIKVYAIPVYRLMYRATLKSGMAVMDATLPILDVNTFRIDWPLGGIRRHNKIGHHQRRMTGSGYMHPSEIINAAFYPEENIQHLVDSLFEAMWARGPIKPSMWENERIIPEFGPQKDGNVITLSEYNERCILGQDPGPEPTFPIKKVEVASKTSLFNPRNPRNNNKAKSDQQPLDTDSSSTTEERPSRTAASRTLGQSTLLRRRTHYRDQAGIRLGNVKKSIRMSPEEEYVTKLPVFLPDPQGYYATLGISQPAKDFLKSEKRDYIDDLISDRRNKKSFECHPDYGGSHILQRELNEAFYHLESLEKRRQYHARSKGLSSLVR